MPVTLLPGRFRLATNPIAAGSAASVVTVGMVEVAAFTATAARQHCPGAAGAAIDVRFTLMSGGRADITRGRVRATSGNLTAL